MRETWPLAQEDVMLTEITSLERYTSFTSPEHYESPGSQTRGPEMWSPIPRVPQSVGQSSPQSGVGRGTGRFPCGAGGSPVLVGWLEEQGSCPMASRSPGLRGDHQAYGGRADVMGNQVRDPPLHAGRKQGGRAQGAGGEPARRACCQRGYRGAWGAGRVNPQSVGATWA